jgi:hypothetical protein
MGAGHQFEIEGMRDRKKILHPVWSAVGCFTLAGLTTLGYFLGDWFIGANSQAGWIPLPREWAWPAESPYLLVKLITALLVLLLGSTLISIVYTMVNPPKPGKFDVTDATIFPPPPRRRM